MNRRDIEKYRNVDEFWDKKIEEELGLSSLAGKAENLKNK